MPLPVRSTPRTFVSLVSFAFLTVAALALLAACDAGGPGHLAPETESAEPPALHADSLMLGVSPMPVGAKLLPPGAAQPGAATRAKKGGASPYGCYLASRPYTDEVRFHSIYLHFPRGLVKAAGEETERLIFRLYARQDGRTDGTGVRYAHCVIPKGKAARKLTMRQVVRAGETKAVQEAVQDANEGAKATGAEAGAKSSCRLVEVVVCVGPDDNGEVSCGSNYEWQGCGGGGLPWPGGDDEDEGNSYPGTDSNCEPVDPTADDPVSKVELADLFVEFCGLPESTDPDDPVMPKIFEASVRKTFNAASPSTHQFVKGPHPQLTNPVDGYSEAFFDLQNGQTLSILTSIVEAKFTEDAGQISFSQSSQHIRDLAASYDQVPPGEVVTGAPAYVVVTNSQRSPSEIGRYSFGAGQYDLPSYANNRGVNFLHYRVMRTRWGGLKLEGDVLGNAQTTRSAIQDFFGNFDVALRIQCLPTN